MSDLIIVVSCVILSLILLVGIIALINLFDSGSKPTDSSVDDNNNGSSCTSCDDCGPCCMGMGH